MVDHLSRYKADFCVIQSDVEFGDNVDQATFEQILDMDEDEDKDFSKSIVFGFLEQAEQTFGKMETAL